MSTTNQKIHIPKKIGIGASTPPPKVIDLKFKLGDGSSYDEDITAFDTIELDFLFSDSNLRSPADQYLIEIQDLDTGNKKSQVLNNKRPFYYWQRSQEGRGRNAEEITDDIIQDGVVNAKIVITPINSAGVGKRSTFFMPMLNLDFVSNYSLLKNPAMLILAKYWHLFSKTPEEILNRPKTMHIYIDVPDESILLDKQFLGQDEQFYNTVGDYKIVNQEQPRWIIQDPLDPLDIKSGYRILEDTTSDEIPEDSFRAMTQEEQTFIDLLIGTINDRYHEYISAMGINREQGCVFKIAVKNPRDHNDSIIIYLMKGQRWQR